MNKLYIVKFFMYGDCSIFTATFWNKTEMIDYLRENYEWNYKVTEDNDIHMIVEGR